MGWFKQHISPTDIMTHISTDSDFTNKNGIYKHFEKSFTVNGTGILNLIKVSEAYDSAGNSGSIKCEVDGFDYNITNFNIVFTNYFKITYTMILNTNFSSNYYTLELKNFFTYYLL